MKPFFKTDRYVIKYKDEKGSNKVAGKIKDTIKEKKSIGKDKKYDVIITNEAIKPDDPVQPN